MCMAAILSRYIKGKIDQYFIAELQSKQQSDCQFPFGIKVRQDFLFLREI